VQVNSNQVYRVGELAEVYGLPGRRLKQGAQKSWRRSSKGRELLLIRGIPLKATVKNFSMENKTPGSKQPKPS